MNMIMVRRVKTQDIQTRQTFHTNIETALEGGGDPSTPVKIWGATSEKAIFQAFKFDF